MKPEKLGQSKQLQTAKYLVDANVFLEVELEQKKADVCERVLRNFISGNWRAYLSISLLTLL